ncbi:hypothetical protein HYS29_00710 [Candidatus Microgenomates bacterium]|nr:hypothetical protein [Candidatus Microgenomates bacterium]
MSNAEGSPKPRVQSVAFSCDLEKPTTSAGRIPHLYIDGEFIPIKILDGEGGEWGALRLPDNYDLSPDAVIGEVVLIPKEELI